MFFYSLWLSWGLFKWYGVSLLYCGIFCCYKFFILFFVNCFIFLDNWNVGIFNNVGDILCLLLLVGEKGWDCCDWGLELGFCLINDIEWFDVGEKVFLGDVKGFFWKGFFGVVGGFFGNGDICGDYGFCVFVLEVVFWEGDIFGFCFFGIVFGFFIDLVVLGVWIIFVIWLFVLNVEKYLYSIGKY